MSLFSNKPAPRREAAAPPQPGFAPVNILAASVRAAAGDNRHALYRAFALNQVSAKADPSLRAMSPASHRPMPVKTMRHEAMHDYDPVTRITTLAEEALLEAAAAMPPETDWTKVLIYAVLPPASTARGARLSGERFKARLAGIDPVFEATSWRFAPAGQTVAEHLAEACALLATGAYATVLFGAADALTDATTCQELAQHLPLLVTDSGVGLVPSEGACFLALSARSPEAGPALGTLVGLGVAPEPHPLEPDLHPMAGLARAITTALAQAKRAPGAVSGALVPVGAEPLGVLEWHQVTQRLWPLIITEQQRLAVQLGEIEQPEIPDDPRPAVLTAAMPLGETGVAALPLLVAAATAWFENAEGFARANLPAKRHVLVAEMGIAPARAALLLEAPVPPEPTPESQPTT